MFKQKVLVQVCLIVFVTCLMANLAHGALITMDIGSSISISDFDMSHIGDELKIDYLIENTTQSSDLSDALYRILIPAGTDQTIYAVQVPDPWVAVITGNQVELYTFNGYEAIQCGESKLFSIFAYNQGQSMEEIQAMTSIGDWATPDFAYVPNGQVPEPTTICLLIGGICLLKRRN